MVIRVALLASFATSNFGLAQDRPRQARKAYNSKGWRVPGLRLINTSGQGSASDAKRGHYKAAGPKKPDDCEDIAFFTVVDEQTIAMSPMKMFVLEIALFKSAGRVYRYVVDAALCHIEGGKARLSGSLVKLVYSAERGDDVFNLLEYPGPLQPIFDDAPRLPKTTDSIAFGRLKARSSHSGR